MTEKSKSKAYKIVNLSPFINRKSTLFVFSMILISLVPQIAMLFITKSFSNLILCGICISACIISEIPDFGKNHERKISILMCFVKGILIGFFLPASYPAISVFFITLFIMLILKYTFGNLSDSWINPVVLTVAVCWFIGQINFPGFIVTKDFLLSKNPSLNLIQEGIIPILPFDDAVTSFFNETIFGSFRVSIPSGYVSFFFDSQSVIPAFRFNFFTCISLIFLIAFDILSFEVSLVYLLTYLIAVRFVSPVFTGGIPLQGDMILALFTSGTIFTSCFLIEWFGTVPFSKAGKIVYAFIGGIIAFIISGCGTSPIGSIMTVLFLNIISPMIQCVEERIKKNKMKNLLRDQNV